MLISIRFSFFKKNVVKMYTYQCDAIKFLGKTGPED